MTCLCALQLALHLPQDLAGREDGLSSLYHSISSIVLVIVLKLDGSSQVRTSAPDILRCGDYQQVQLAQSQTAQNKGWYSISYLD